MRVPFFFFPEGREGKRLSWLRLAVGSSSPLLAVGKGLLIFCRKGQGKLNPSFFWEGLLLENDKVLSFHSSLR